MGEAQYEQIKKKTGVCVGSMGSNSNRVVGEGHRERVMGTKTWNAESQGGGVKAGGGAKATLA